VTTVLHIEQVSTAAFRIIVRTVFYVLFAVGPATSAIAQTTAANEQSLGDNQSGAEVSKQVANPLSNLWLMQFQQNDNWIGMPANGGDRVQSSLQFQPLLPVKLTDNWNLITRPVLQLYDSTPFLDQNGQERRQTGFGDTVLAFALSPGPALVGHWLLASGPHLSFQPPLNRSLGNININLDPLRHSDIQANTSSLTFSRSSGSRLAATARRLIK
jgi:hypothetical protein